MSVNVGDIIAYLTLDKSKFKRGLAGSSRDLGGYISSTIGMMARWGARLAAIGTAAFVGISVKGAMFERSIARLAGVTGSGLDKMRTEAIAMGKATIFSASQAAKAMYNLASAGMSAGEVIAGIEPAILLATGQQISLADATDVLTSTMKQFGLEAKDMGHIADVMTAAIGGSKLNVEKFREAMKFAGPEAQGLKWSLEDVTASVGAFVDITNQGGLAGRKWVAALADMASPGKKASEIFAKWNIDLDKINPYKNPKGGLAGIVAYLAKSKITAEDMSQAFSRASKGVMIALVEAARKSDMRIDKIRGKLKDVAGDAKDLADKSASGVWGAWKNVASRIEALMIALYGTWKKQLKAGLDDLVKALDKAIKLVDDNKDSFIAFFSAIALILRGIVSAARQLLPAMGAMKKMVGDATVNFLPVALKMWNTYAVWRRGMNTMAKSSREQKGWFGGAKKKPEEEWPMDEDPGEFDMDDKVKDTVDKVKKAVKESKEAVGDGATWAEGKLDKIADATWAEGVLKRTKNVWSEMFKGFGDTFLDGVSRKLAGFKVNWESMWKSMKATMIRQLLEGATKGMGGIFGGRGGGGGGGGGGMLGGISRGLFGRSFGGTIGGGILGSMVGGFAVSSILGGLMGGQNNVGVDDRTKAQQYTQAVTSAREQAKAQAKALADAMNSGEMDMDSDLLKELTSFQFSDPTVSYHHHRRGGLKKRSKTEYWSLTNAAQIDAQLAQFGALMEQVQGSAANSRAFQEATGQAAFTGSGSNIITNLSINAGVIIADERTKDSLARDTYDRLLRLGLLAHA